MAVFGAESRAVRTYLEHLCSLLKSKIGDGSDDGSDVNVTFRLTDSLESRTIQPFRSMPVITSFLGSPVDEEDDGSRQQTARFSARYDGKMYKVVCQNTLTYDIPGRWHDNAKSISGINDRLVENVIGVQDGENICLGFNLAALLEDSSVVSSETGEALPRNEIRTNVLFSYLDNMLYDPFRRAFSLCYASLGKGRDSYVNWKYQWASKLRAEADEAAGAASSEARDLWYKYVEVSAKARKLTTTVEAYDRYTKGEHLRAAVQEWDGIKILRDLGKVNDLVLSDTLLSFTTDIIVLKSSKTDDTCELGPFNVEIPMTGSTRGVVITADDGAMIRNGHPHPHLGSGGHPCFGNAEEILATAISNYEVAGIINTILHFLNSYNSSNPYVSLEKFTNGEDGDEDDEEERYESCYANSSGAECVRCSDDACQYSDDAMSRCYENSDSEGCAMCGVDWCDHQSEGMSLCYQEHAGDRISCIRCACCNRGTDDSAADDCVGEQDSPSACITCSVNSCDRQGDYEKCHAYVQANGLDDCKECSEEDCGHRLTDENEDDEEQGDMFDQPAQVAEPSDGGGAGAEGDDA